MQPNPDLAINTHKAYSHKKERRSPFDDLQSDLG
jgi:hypothetical protein